VQGFCTFDTAMEMSRRLTVALAALMATQSLLGLTLDHEYRDPDWIRATWFGNDWFTLVVAAPLLGASAACVERGSVTGQRGSGGGTPHQRRERLSRARGVAVGDTR
jgi:hypothetical protein